MFLSFIPRLLKYGPKDGMGDWALLEYWVLVSDRRRSDLKGVGSYQYVWMNMCVRKQYECGVLPTIPVLECSIECFDLLYEKLGKVSVDRWIRQQSVVRRL